MKDFVLRFFKILNKDKFAVISGFILLFWIIIAFLPFMIPSLTNIPLTLNERLANPSSKFLFGVDGNGQSVGLLIMNGASTSLIVSLFTVSMSLFVGIPLGAIAGFFGGRIDIFISRFIDILLAFPPMVLPIAIMAFFGGGLINVVIALSLTGWVSYARVVRGQFLSFKEREFVVAAQSLGASSTRVMFKHIFPNTISPLAVQATFSLAGVIIAEAGLSFLGLGVSQAHVSWGGLLNSARDYLTSNPTLAFFPSLALFSVVASLNFIGETLRLTFDPKSIGAGRM
ncbi:ABC transporter permease [Fluviispira multicolorata]|uniref:ABC transporter permease subunit n=1 Tax=Fluviispira multicolorata TaxID=2654512 RepID=A0A833N0J6_9BACT|nr:ABC transporter permease [Fluviispira multicolorata]KAB8028607.1 ABC transporter permease subunit [Fluviispira multicolorata]